MKKSIFELKINGPHVYGLAVSRMLDCITSRNYVHPDLNALIDSELYHAESGPQKVIATMLKMLAFSDRSFVSYCFDCDKYLLSDNNQDNLCAYDTFGHGDSHRTYKIFIREETIDAEYMCFWGEGYDPVPPMIIKLDGFTEERGYTEADQTILAELRVGESAMFNDGGMHTVVRIK